MDMACTPRRLLHTRRDPRYVFTRRRASMCVGQGGGADGERARARPISGQPGDYRYKRQTVTCFPPSVSCTAERYHRFGCSVFRRRLGAYGGGPTVFVIRFGCRSSWLPTHSPTAVSLLWQKSGRCLRGSAISVNQHTPLLHHRYELVQSFRVSHVSFMPAAMPRVRP